MKRSFLLISLLVSINLHCSSQIGVNTDNPQALFHVDAKGNTTGATNFSDDFVITTTGQVGVGTLSPEATLDIRGRIDFDKTNRVTGSYVKSSATGVASWGDPIILNRVAKWEVAGPSTSFKLDTETILSGTGQLKESEIPGLSISNNETLSPGVTGAAIKIPAGQYILYPSCRLNGREYGLLRIYEVGNSATPILSVNYSMSALGISHVINISSTKTYYMTFTAKNASSTLYTKPPFTSTYTAGLIVQNIQ